MESKTTNVEELFQKVKTYADVRLNLLKLQAINKISGFMSAAITIVIMCVLFLFVLICITIGLALLIGNIAGNGYVGFFAVAGLYFIIGLLLFFLRRKLIKAPISNKLIKSFFN